MFEQIFFYVNLRTHSTMIALRSFLFCYTRKTKKKPQNNRLGTFTGYLLRGKRGQEPIIRDTELLQREKVPAPCVVEVIDSESAIRAVDDIIEEISMSAGDESHIHDQLISKSPQ